LKSIHFEKDSRAYDFESLKLRVQGIEAQLKPLSDLLETVPKAKFDAVEADLKAKIKDLEANTACTQTCSIRIMISM